MRKTFPPRGNPNNPIELPYDAEWADPDRLGPSWTYRDGAALLGRWGERLIGRIDDRHIITIAGSRAGKSQTVLIPNLKSYTGSAVVIDPKGELTETTARHRRALGQKVFILDPLDELARRGSQMRGSSFNPFDELLACDPQYQYGEAAALAESLIVNEGKDPHWPNSARKILHAVILHLLSGEASQPATLGTLTRFFASTRMQQDFFERMIVSQAFDGFPADVATTALARLRAGGTEYGSIMSTGDTQLAPLRDIDRISKSSDFALRDLRGGMTLYLVLPATKLGVHFRWLRLVINMALAAMERNPASREAKPVWFILEEFAALGQMRSIEMAAGYMAGYGVKLWVILQDLTQLKTHYPQSWETFLGNAGIIQAFGNVDATTTEYLAKMLGQTTIMERQSTRLTSRLMQEGDTGIKENPRHLQLLDASEITYYFARETGRQLILCSGRPPIYLQRLSIGEVR